MYYSIFAKGTHDEIHFIFIMSQVDQAQESTVVDTKDSEENAENDSQKESQNHESQIREVTIPEQEDHEPPQADNEVPDQKKVAEVPQEDVTVPTEVIEKIENRDTTGENIVETK